MSFENFDPEAARFCTEKEARNALLLASDPRANDETLQATEALLSILYEAVGIWDGHQYPNGQPATPQHRAAALIKAIDVLAYITAERMDPAGQIVFYNHLSEIFGSRIGPLRAAKGQNNPDALLSTRARNYAAQPMFWRFLRQEKNWLVSNRELAVRAVLDLTESTAFCEYDTNQAAGLRFIRLGHSYKNWLFEQKHGSR